MCLLNENICYFVIYFVFQCPYSSHSTRKLKENYSETGREKHHPVITYQDNMQLARTSMRHLQLSKLQKEKVKQGKMWDFTVRGWRAANINGIEHLFDDEETASKQPRELKSLEYEETKIGKMVALLSARLFCLKSPPCGTICQHVLYPIIEVHPLR